jgi:hypothetical protein
MWVSLGSLVTFIIVLLRSDTGYPFPTESCIELCFLGEWFSSPFFPLLYLVLFSYVFDKLVGDFDCLISFPD